MAESVAEVVCTHLADALRYHRLGSLFLAGFEFSKATSIVDDDDTLSELTPKEKLKLEQLVDAVGSAFQNTFNLFEEPALPVPKPKKIRAAHLTTPQVRRHILDSISNSRARNEPIVERLKERWERERKK